MAKHVTVVEQQQNPLDDHRLDLVIPEKEDLCEYGCSNLDGCLGDAYERAEAGEKGAKSKEEKTL